MHRSTHSSTLHRSYDSGGARATIDKVNDDSMMQEMSGNFMKGESGSEIESPQNYGFSSVVRPAKKGQDGQIEESAEGFISFMGGNRSFPVCGVMDDRRYRPRGLKPGENSQYDDLGQMTLLRRSGLYLLSLDGEDDSQQDSSGGSGGSGGGASTREGESGGNGGGQTVERFVSIRHVEKQKQPKPQSQSSSGNGASGGGSGGGAAATTLESGSGGASSGGSGQSDFKHEGESVNLEMRVSKKRIEFRSGDDVVGYYDKEGKTWVFIGKVKLGSESADNPVYGVGDSGTGNISDKDADDAVFINAPKPGPPTALDTEP